MTIRVLYTSITVYVFKRCLRPTAAAAVTAKYTHIYTHVHKILKATIASLMLLKA